MKASNRQVGGNHYKDMKIQPGEFIVENGLGWHEGNAVKYICRHHLKGGPQDIDKAIHYLELLKELAYEREGSDPATAQPIEPVDSTYSRGHGRAGCEYSSICVGDCQCTGASRPAELYAGEVGGGRRT